MINIVNHPITVMPTTFLPFQFSLNQIHMLSIGIQVLQLKKLCKLQIKMNSIGYIIICLFLIDDKEK